MDMFSKELYELDKNTVQYMIDEQEQKIDEQKQKLSEQKQKIGEMKETIDKQKQEIDEMQELHTKTIDEMQKERAKERNEMQKQGIRNAVALLQDMKVPEQEIRTRICERYQISEEQVSEFLTKNKIM